MEEALRKALSTILECFWTMANRDSVDQDRMTTMDALKFFSSQVPLRFWHTSGLSPDLTIEVTKFAKGLVLLNPNDEALLLQALKDLLRKGSDRKSFLVIRCILDKDQEWQVLIKRGSTAGNVGYQQVVTGY